MKIKAVFRFKPFSRKAESAELVVPLVPGAGLQRHYRRRRYPFRGKSVAMSLSFVIWAMSEFEACNFAMCGKTIGSFRRNVLFWLKLMLRSRGYSVSEQRTENLVSPRAA